MSVQQKKPPNLRSRRQPKHYVGGSNEFGNSREEVRKKKKRGLLSLTILKWLLSLRRPIGWSQRGGTVGKDSRRSPVSCCDEPSQTGRRGGSGHPLKDTRQKMAHWREESVYSEVFFFFLLLLFRRMPARSVCLSVWQSLFCLTPYLVVSHTARGETKISWCLHKHQTPRSCLFLNQRLKKKRKEKKEKNRGAGLDVEMFGEL